VTSRSMARAPAPPFWRPVGRDVFGPGRAPGIPTARRGRVLSTLGSGREAGPPKARNPPRPHAASLSRTGKLARSSTRAAQCPCTAAMAIPLIAPTFYSQMIPQYHLLRVTKSRIVNICSPNLTIFPPPMRQAHNKLGTRCSQKKKFKRILTSNRTNTVTRDEM